MNRKKVLLQVSIIIGIIIVVNIISQGLFIRLDYTADQRYTLSSTTLNIIKDLDEVITARVYFSQEVPPELLVRRRDLQNLLVEYENSSNGNVIYKLVNPKDEELQAEAQKAGIAPIIVNVQGRNKLNKLQVYMGIVIEKGTNKETIPFLDPDPNISVEYALTKAIKKVSIDKKLKIAVLQGHQEPAIDASPDIQNELSLFYDFESYTIKPEEDISQDYKAVVIINPVDTFKSSELEKLNRYLGNGGGIYLAYTPVEGNLTNLQLTAKNDIGLSGWLATQGLTMEKKFIVDAKCGAVTVTQQQGIFRYNSQIQFPYFPVIINFDQHPISKNLESVFLPFASPITISPQDSNLIYTPLAYTSAKSGTAAVGGFIDINKKWSQQDFQDDGKVVAVAVEGFNNSTGRLVVIANDQFATGQQSRNLGRDNANLAINAIDWLADDTGLINLRSKTITSRPLTPDLEDDDKNILAYMNVFMPILLILIYAFIKRQRQIKKRNDWINYKY